MKLTEPQWKCLEALDDCTEPRGELCAPFVEIEQRTGFDRRAVRLHVRELARLGLAEYHRALWSDDGPAGAGYSISEAGRAAVAKEHQK